MRKIVTFLWFNDQAKEAVDLYVSLFENAKIINTSYLTESVAKAAGKKAGALSFDLLLSDESLHPYHGSFRVLDRSVDPQTGTMKAQAVFPNPGSYLRPGQFARLRVAVAQRENAILVPQRAIQELQGAKTVMIVDAENKVSLRTIKIGDKADKDVVVIEGLSGGERVIVEGMQKVRPGGQVNPTTGNQTSANTQGG